MEIGIVSEGYTDQIVIENILQEYTTAHPSFKLFFEELEREIKTL